MDPGQLGVRDRPVTEEERAAVRPADKGRPPTEAMPIDGTIRARERSRIKTQQIANENENITAGGNVTTHGDPSPECPHQPKLVQLRDTGIYIRIFYHTVVFCGDSDPDSRFIGGSSLT